MKSTRTALWFAAFAAIAAATPDPWRGAGRLLDLTVQWPGWIASAGARPAGSGEEAPSDDDLAGDGDIDAAELPPLPAGAAAAAGLSGERVAPPATSSGAYAADVASVPAEARSGAGAAAAEAVRGVPAAAPPWLARVVDAPIPPPATPFEWRCGVADPTRCAAGPLPKTRAALSGLAAGTRRVPVRLMWFGDSLVMGDHVTGDLREALQAQLGDGGHGFHFIGNPGHRPGARGVQVTTSDRWDVTTVVRTLSRGQALGLGGASFEARPGDGPTVTISVEAPAQFRRLAVLAIPAVGGSSFSVRDGSGRRQVALDGAARSGSVTWVDVDASRPVTVSGLGQGVRWHGVSIESGSPGVIVDNLGMVSSELSDMLKIDRQTWAEQARALSPTLLVFQYGANVAWQGASTSAATRLRERSREWLARVREDLPDTECLVVGMLTRGDWVEGEARVRRSVEQVVRIQRETALEAGCAFWSAFDAAGGFPGLERWRQEGKLGGDLSHPTRAGYAFLAEDFRRALMHAWLGPFALTGPR